MNQIKKTYFIHKRNNIGIEHNPNYLEGPKQGGFD